MDAFRARPCDRASLSPRLLRVHYFCTGIVAVLPLRLDEGKRCSVSDAIWDSLERGERFGFRSAATAALDAHDRHRREESRILEIEAVD